MYGEKGSSRCGSGLASLFDVVPKSSVACNGALTGVADSLGVERPSSFACNSSAGLGPLATAKAGLNQKNIPFEKMKSTERK